MCSGILNAGTDREYTFVYDCGTESSQRYIEQEINEFVSNISKTRIKENKKEIEFVVISHLHWDHFSGLGSLMRKVHVNKIYLPYLGQWKQNADLIRLIVACAILFNDDGFNETNFATYRQIVDLYEHSGQREDGTHVIFLLGERTEEDERNDGIVVDPLYFPYMKQIRTKDVNFWQFTLINKRFGIKNLEHKVLRLNEAMSNMLKGKTIGQFLDEQFLNSGDNGIMQIRDIYRKVFNKKRDILNLTSTIMMHCPSESSDTLFIGENCGKRECCRCFPSADNWLKNASQLYLLVMPNSTIKC